MSKVSWTYLEWSSVWLRRVSVRKFVAGINDQLHGLADRLQGTQDNRPYTVFVG